MRFVVIILSIFLNSPYSIAEENKCSTSSENLTSILKLDYKSFDQTLPDGGWRDIEQKGCPLEAAKVIDIYHLHHQGDLVAWQERILYWHAGQVYACEGLNELALLRFHKSIDPQEKPDDGFMWNTYVKGSIAFLERDRVSLQKFRDEMANAKKKSEPNFRIIDAMFHCFDRPYKEVSSGVCVPKKE